MRRRDVVQERAERQSLGLAEHGFFGLREPGENCAAALGFRPQQAEIVRVRIGRAVSLKLMGHHRDGRERGPKLVRRRGGKRAQGCKAVLARQHELGCR